MPPTRNSPITFRRKKKEDKEKKQEAEGRGAITSISAAGAHHSPHTPSAAATSPSADHTHLSHKDHHSRDGEAAPHTDHRDRSSHDLAAGRGRRGAGAWRGEAAGSGSCGGPRSSREEGVSGGGSLRGEGCILVGDRGRSCGSRLLAGSRDGMGVESASGSGRCGGLRLGSGER